VGPDEDCDDNNQSNEDACVADCKDAACGDGYTFIGVEECDDGATNADNPAFSLSWQAASSPVLPVASVADAAIFYNYFSASGHTGFEKLNTTVLFLYVNTTTEALSLFIEHGIDFTTTGQSQALADVAMDLTGLPAASVVALSDDPPAEFFKLTPTSMQGAWQTLQNTEGGVASGLAFPGNWTIDISISFSGAITTWEYKNGGSVPETIPLTGTTATLRAFDAPSLCRTTCTVPACGDGILDGGEVCDDGNTVPADGCAADCAAF
jgi:cysteine-rich repeat protein